MTGRPLIAAWAQDTSEGIAAVRRAMDEADLRQLPVGIFVTVKLAGSSPEIPALERAEATASRWRDELDERPTDGFVECITGLQPHASLLLRHLTHLKPKLLVLGMRSRSPVGKLVMGSNAQDLILQAECPVLAIKTVDDH